MADITVPTKGLLPLSHDRSKDKVQVRKFGGVSTSDFPLSLGRLRMPVDDQQDTEFCTCFQTSKARAYATGIDMSAEWQVAKAGEFTGRPIVDGTDPMSAMDAQELNGSLPKSFAPFTLEDKGADFISDWTNWPRNLDSLAQTYRAKTPYSVGHGTGDVFDNIRGALLNAFQAGETEPVLAFGNWYMQWNIAANNPILRGKMPTPVAARVSLHAYLFIDWITDPDGTPFLVGHLSQGKGYGDNGFLLFSREAVNAAYANMLTDGIGLYIWRKDGANPFGALLAYLANRLKEIVRQLALQK